MPDYDKDIEDFLKFMGAHGDSEMLYVGSGGMLVTKGCNGTFGTCCSKGYDLTGLVDTLRELSSKPR